MGMTAAAHQAIKKRDEQDARDQAERAAAVKSEVLTLAATTLGIGLQESEVAITDDGEMALFTWEGHRFAVQQEPVLTSPRADDDPPELAWTLFLVHPPHETARIDELADLGRALRDCGYFDPPAASSGR